MIIKGKTLCLLFAADPAKYEGTKVAVEKDQRKIIHIPHKSPRRVNYALEVIADIMKDLGAEKHCRL